MINTHQMIEYGFERGFNGWIDEVGIWNEALDATAINDVFANGIPEPATLSFVGVSSVAMLLVVRRMKL